MITLSEKPEMSPTREGFGKGLLEAGSKNDKIVALCADLTESTKMNYFAEKFPDRFIEIGVAEQNLATVAAGLANYGKIPFIASYAAFSPGRNYEQIRTTAALNNVPVKVIGAHAGVSVGPDGATHQMLEDIAMMRAMPNMIVVVPCDAVEAKKATLEIAENGKPSYLRLGREKSPVITAQDTPFHVGKAEIFRDGKDVAIIACGILVYEAMLAAGELSKEGIEAMVINNHTIKPIDADTIVSAAKKCGAVVTAEEHQIMGGMGSAVAEVIVKNHPVPMEFVGINDRFGESGKADELLKHFGLDSKSISIAAKKAINRRDMK